MQKTVQFVSDKETKGTFRFKEQPEVGQPPAIGTLYVQKWAIPAGTEKVTVTLEVAG